jgi:hypothetical protein
LCDHLSFSQDEHLIGESPCEAQVVRCNSYSAAFTCRGGNDAGDLGCALWIQARRGLVQQEDTTAEDDRGSEDEAPLLPSGDSKRIRVPEVGEADSAEGRQGDFGAVDGPARKADGDLRGYGTSEQLVLRPLHDESHRRRGPLAPSSEESRDAQ